MASVGAKKLEDKLLWVVRSVTDVMTRAATKQQFWLTAYRYLSPSFAGFAQRIIQRA